MSWIKLRDDIRDDPAVEFIASRCSVTALHAVGALASAWSWAGRLSDDGKVPLGTPALLDKITGTPGFSAAMVAAGWLEVGESYLVFPKWDRHNESGAKARALATERQRRKRVTVERDEVDTLKRDQRRGEERRGEEKREEKKEESTQAADSPSARRKRAPFDWRLVLLEFPALDNLEVREACGNFCEARRSKHGPWTAQGMRIAVRKFLPLGTAALVRAFEQATESPWMSIKTPEELSHGHGRNGSSGPSNGAETQLERRKREGMDELFDLQRQAQ